MNNKIRHSKILGAFFFCLALILVCTRYFLLLNQIDLFTGFYSLNNWLSRSFDLSIVLIAIVGLILSFFGPAPKGSAKILIKTNLRILWSLASIALGLFLIYDFFSLSIISSRVVFLPLGIEVQSVGLPNFLARLNLSISGLLRILNLLSGSLLLTQGALLINDNFQKLLTSPLFKALYLLPITWIIIAIMRISMAYSTICYISEHILEVITLIFILKSFFSQAVILTSTQPSNMLLKSCQISCAFSAFFSLLTTLPLLSLKITSRPELLGNPFFYGKFIMLSGAFGLYLFCIWIALTKAEQSSNKTSFVGQLKNNSERS